MSGGETVSVDRFGNGLRQRKTESCHRDDYKTRFINTTPSGRARDNLQVTVGTGDV